jgi:PAS domain S-box-containing protein
VAGRPQLGVGAKFGLSLSLLGLVTIGTMGYYAYNEARNMLVTAAKQRLVTTTTVLGHRFTAAVDQVARDVALMARLEEVNELAVGAEDAEPLRTRLADIFAATLSLHPEYLQLRLIGKQDFGREVVRVDRTDDGTARITGSELQEKGHFPYVYRTLAQPAGAFYLSKIELNLERGVRFGLDKPTVRIAMPVHAPVGNVFGLVIVNVDLDGLFTQLRADLPADIELFLTNAEGDYLIHPDPAKTFGFNQGRRVRIQDDFAPTAGVLAGTSSHVLLDTRNRIAAFVGVPFGPIAAQRSVLLGLGMPTHMAVLGITSFADRLVLIVSGFGVLTVLASFLLSRLLVRPLDRVVSGLNRFSRGLPLPALPTARKDEIGLLSRSFVSMANQLGSQIETLKVNEQNLHRILEAAPSDVVITSRDDHRTLFMNTSARSRFGLQEAGTTLDPLRHGIGPEQTEELYRELERDGRIDYRECRFRLNGDDAFWALISMVEIAYQDQPAVLLSIVDISQRKETEMQLDRYRNELEEVIEQRTAALLAAQHESLRNERLVAIGQLTGTVSHELRNPLGTIQQSFAILRMLTPDEDPRLARAFDRIDRSIARCDRIIQELLDYARSRDLELESTDVDEWLRLLLDEQELPAEVRLERSLRSAARVSIDRHRLSQAVINVVQNACQAVAESGVPRERAIVQVRSRVLDGRLEIEVEDNGPGIELADRERVFEPLFSTRSFGIGLGLPLVKQVMELHEGGIELHSEPGSGTRVLLWLGLPG